MKITKVEPILTGWRRMFVKVYTDEGIVGVAEGGNWGFRESMVGAIHRMEEPLLGQDPLRIEYLTRELYSRFKFGGTSVCGAISAMSDMIHAVREAVGLDMDIGCEIHRSLQPHESVELMRRIADCDLLFFEVPINYENYSPLQAVCRKAQVPVSVGERSFCIQDVDMLLREDLVSFIRPDMCIIGGITGCKRRRPIPAGHAVDGAVSHCSRYLCPL